MKKAAATRLDILRKAFELIYVKGYQNTSIDDILARTQVTKGAFYYHFSSKDEMGVAIIKELLGPTLNTLLVMPFQEEGDALDTIYKVMHYLLMEDEFMKVEHGCPAANLTQEMTPWHGNFTEALNGFIRQWQDVMIRNIEKAKKAGSVRKDVNARQVALFVMSGYWGIRNLGKLENSRAVYRPYLKELKAYLDSLR